MEYHSALPIYDGKMRRCVYCEEVFRPGDMIAVSKLGLIFCKPPESSCVLLYSNTHNLDFEWEMKFVSKNGKPKKNDEEEYI